METLTKNQKKQQKAAKRIFYSHFHSFALILDQWTVADVKNHEKRKSKNGQCQKQRKATKSSKEQQKATKSNKEQQRATKSNKEQQRATKSNKKPKRVSWFKPGFRLDLCAFRCSFWFF